jgi:hypothetical protein
MKHICEYKKLLNIPSRIYCWFNVSTHKKSLILHIYATLFTSTCRRQPKSAFFHSQPLFEILDARFDFWYRKYNFSSVQNLIKHICEYKKLLNIASRIYSWLNFSTHKKSLILHMYATLITSTCRRQPISAFLIHSLYLKF